MEGVVGGPGMIRGRGHCSQDIWEENLFSVKGNKILTIFLLLKTLSHSYTWEDSFKNITKYFPILHISHNKCENIPL